MIVPKPTEGGEFTPVPAGSHLAVCYRFIDLGTQTTEFNGEKKTRREVMISWELPDEMTEDGRPMSINKRYTWSMHEKATLRKHLEAWRGKPFVDADFEPETGFNIANIIGKACVLTVAQTHKDGKTYSNVAGVGKLMKSMTAPDRSINEPAYLSLTQEGWDATVFAGLSDYFKGVITGSPEYSDIMQKNYRSDDPGSQSKSAELDDEIPF